MKLLNFSKVFLSEFRLYLCNYVISNIPIHSFRLWYYRGIMGFNIGKESSIFMGSKFDCARGFIMGENSVINANCRIDTRGGIEIGSNVSISEDVILLTADHDLDSVDFKGRNKKIIINDFVWIGTRSMLLPGVKLGKGAVVAAGSVVTKNVDSLTVVGGVPAKFIRERKIEKLSYNTVYKRLFQ